MILRGVRDRARVTFVDERSPIGDGNPITVTMLEMYRTRTTLDARTSIAIVREPEVSEPPHTSAHHSIRSYCSSKGV